MQRTWRRSAVWIPAFAVSVAIFLVHGSAVAAPRAALVIGNAGYPDGDETLKTPIADVDEMARALEKRSFVVESAKNATRKQMDAAIARFLARIEPGSDVAIFYAGYGVQVGRRNYLLPTDSSKIWGEADVQRDGIAVDSLLADAARKGAQTRIVMLDASRRNPYERRFRGLSAGLAAATPKAGVLMFSSAAAGTVLAESDAANSHFVVELRKQMDVSAMTAEQAFETSRDNISRTTQGQQTPVVVSGLDVPFYFDPTRKAPEAKIAATQQPIPVAPAAIEPQKVLPPSTKSPAQLEPPQATRLDPPAVATGGGAPRPGALELPPLPGSPASAVKPVMPQESKAPEPKTQTALAAPTPVVPGPANPSRPTAPPASPPTEMIPQSEDKTASRPADFDPASRRAGLTAMIARNPRDIEALSERGQLAAAQGQFAPAIADFDRVLKVDAKNVEALNNRCWVRAIRNELQTALSDCNEALRLRHDYADAYDSRGMIFLKIGQTRAALADYDAALKIDPSHSSALYGRGVARLRLGEKAEAERDFAGALALNGTVDREYAQYGVR